VDGVWLLMKSWLLLTGDLALACLPYGHSATTENLVPPLPLNYYNYPNHCLAVE
jgi:hypothetical protein